MSGISPASKFRRESDNVMLLAQDLGAGRVVWRSRPTEIEFGFNNHCNLQCVMCHQSDGIPSKEMPMERAREVLAEMLPLAIHLTPSDASEPLMNDLDEIVAQCRHHDVTLLLYCNGTLIDERVFDKVGPVTHRIWFSIDTPDPATFERLRVGADFAQFDANVRAVMPRARKLGVDVGFNAVVMEPNWRQLPGLVDWVADVGGDELQIQELLPNSTGYHRLKTEGVVPDAELARVIEQVRARALARRVNVALHMKQPFGGTIWARPQRQTSRAPLAEVRDLHMDSLAAMHPGFCPMAMSYTKVTPDGNVYPCCRGPDELVMGNVLDESFEAIWNGPRYRAFRQAMLDGAYPDVCASCVVLTGPAHFPGNRTEPADAAPRP